VSYVASSYWDGRRPAKVPHAESLQEGKKLYCLYHRFAPRKWVYQSCRRVIPKVLVHLGSLRGLIYASDRGSCGCPRTYIHFMETPARLACDPQGTQLYILGGRYRVTPRGIEG
jgi:hypothetical protein